MVPKRLQDELKKRDPFESAEQEALLNILRTSDQFQNLCGKLYREHGLTQSQYNVLRILRGEGKPMPCQEISQRMIQAVPAMTGLLDRLESQDLVRRVRCETDRRVIYIEPTPKALDLLAKLDEPMRQMYRKLLGHLSQPELKVLSGLLEKARFGTEPEPE